MQCRTYMRARTHTHAHTYAHTCARTLHMHTCTCTCTFTRTCKTCTYTCMQRSAHVDQQSIRDLKRTQGDSSLSLYTFYVQTHTYIHTHNQRAVILGGFTTLSKSFRGQRESVGGLGAEGRGRPAAILRRVTCTRKPSAAHDRPWHIFPLSDLSCRFLLFFLDALALASRHASPPPLHPDTPAPRGAHARARSLSSRLTCTRARARAHALSHTHRHWTLRAGAEFACSVHQALLHTLSKSRHESFLLATP